MGTNMRRHTCSPGNPGACAAPHSRTAGLQRNGSRSRALTPPCPTAIPRLPHPFLEKKKRRGWHPPPPHRGLHGGALALIAKVQPVAADEVLGEHGVQFCEMPGGCCIKAGVLRYVPAVSLAP